MKMFIILLAQVVSMAAFAAPKATDDWSTIRAYLGSVYIAQPQNANRFGMDGYFNACVEGNQFRSLVPQVVCHKLVDDNNGGGAEGVGSTQTCVDKSLEYIYAPMNIETKVCTKWSYIHKGQEDGGDENTCLEEKTSVTTLSEKLVFSVSQIIPGSQGSSSSKFLFKKDLLVPACK